MKPIPRITQTAMALLRRLTQKKFREQEHRFLVEGPHLVEEMLKSDWQIESVVLRRGNGAETKFQSLLERARKSGIKLYETSEREFDKLADTVTAQGIIAVARMRDDDPALLWGNLRERSTIVALNNVSDPGNVGTIIRTCGWFGVDALLVDQGSVDVYNPKIVRASMGALFHLKIFPHLDLLQTIVEAKQHHFSVAVTALDGLVEPGRYLFAARTLVVFGNEAHGVHPSIREQADLTLMIPGSGTAESLNVAVACGIVLHSLRLSQG